MNHCPICRGRVNAARARCTRCDTDLRFLMQIEHISEADCSLAIQSLLIGDIELARVYAIQALKVMKTPFTQALFLFAHFTFESEL
jgi:hypothetical protein